ncbi:MAG: hydrogenase, partial [Vicinamibacteria bacterium]
MNPESLQMIALSLTEERSVETVLQKIVEGLGSQSGIALARVWLIEPGDICETCPMKSDCADRARCLHLVASHGHPTRPADNWERLDGAFRRFPIGIRKVGRVAASGQPILLKDVSADLHEFARHDWIREER